MKKFLALFFLIGLIAECKSRYHYRAVHNADCKSKIVIPYRKLHLKLDIVKNFYFKNDKFNFEKIVKIIENKINFQALRIPIEFSYSNSMIICHLMLKNFKQKS